MLHICMPSGNIRISVFLWLLKFLVQIGRVPVKISESVDIHQGGLTGNSVLITYAIMYNAISCMYNTHNLIFSYLNCW